VAGVCHAQTASASTIVIFVRIKLPSSCTCRRL
jgi:hypothetical protein